MIRSFAIKMQPHSIMHLSPIQLYLHPKRYSQQSVYILCHLSLGSLPSPSVIANMQVM